MIQRQREARETVAGESGATFSDFDDSEDEEENIRTGILFCVIYFVKCTKHEYAGYKYTLMHQSCMISMADSIDNNDQPDNKSFTIEPQDRMKYVKDFLSYAVERAGMAQRRARNLCCDIINMLEAQVARIQRVEGDKLEMHKFTSALRAIYEHTQHLCIVGFNSARLEVIIFAQFLKKSRYDMNALRPGGFLNILDSIDGIYNFLFSLQKQ